MPAEAASAPLRRLNGAPPSLPLSSSPNGASGLVGRTSGPFAAFAGQSKPRRGGWWQSGSGPTAACAWGAPAAPASRPSAAFCKYTAKSRWVASQEQLLGCTTHLEALRRERRAATVSSGAGGVLRPTSRPLCLRQRGHCVQRPKGDSVHAPAASEPLHSHQTAQYGPCVKTTPSRRPKTPRPRSAAEAVRQRWVCPHAEIARERRASKI